MISLFPHLFFHNLCLNSVINLPFNDMVIKHKLLAQEFTYLTSMNKLSLFCRLPCYDIKYKGK